jgi:hypothetical protein
MKSLIKALLVVLPAFLVACDGNSDGDKKFSRGKITGYDMTLCACCGGYVVEIDGGQYRFSEDDIRGENPFNTWDIDYPVHVFIEWSAKNNDCSGHRIDVFKIIPTTAP